MSASKKETYQAVLSTDGNASFVSLIYENIESVTVGFSAGDQIRNTTIYRSGPLNHLLPIIFRIDGN